MMLLYLWFIFLICY